MFGFYRDYIDHYSELVKPLTKLTRKGVKFTWGDEQRQVVRELADKLEKACLSFTPNGGTFRLETDASEYALGAVLYTQEDYNNGNRLPIMFFSKTLTATEINWDTSEKEAYALVWALDKADSFVKGREIELITDHKNLEWMHNKRRGKVARWVMRLSEYNVIIKYRTGDENVVADFMSRMVEIDPLEVDKAYCFPVGIDEDLEITIDINDNNEEEDKKPKSQIIKYPKITPDQELALQSSDLYEEVNDDLIEFNKIKNWAQEGVSQLSIEEIIKCQQTEPPDRFIRGYGKDGKKITYLGRIWVPPSLRNQILDSAHLLSPYFHPGLRQMIQKITKTFQWEGLHLSVTEYLKGCLICQRTKANYSSQNLTTRAHPVLRPFEVLYMDFWGPFLWNPGEKPTLLITMIDHHTKWAEVGILKNKSAAEICRLLLIKWITRFGAPSKIVTDNDTPFISKAMDDLLTNLGTRHVTTTPYHPQGNAPVESFHRVLKKGLTRIKLQSGKTMRLDEAISWVLFGYHTSFHTSLRDTPAFLTFGIDPSISPTNILQQQPVVTDSRVQILLSFRQELMRQSLIIKNREELAKKSQNGILKLGVIALVNLTPRQLQKLSEKTGSLKITSNWSLPMRIVMINKTKTVAQLQCISTGLITRAHQDRIRIIKIPSTLALKQIWDNICDHEKDISITLKDQYIPAAQKFGKLTLGEKPDTSEGQYPEFSERKRPRSYLKKTE